jgi:hypothetical protein
MKLSEAVFRMDLEKYRVASFAAAIGAAMATGGG